MVAFLPVEQWSEAMLNELALDMHASDFYDYCAFMSPPEKNERQHEEHKVSEANNRPLIGVGYSYCDSRPLNCHTKQALNQEKQPQKASAQINKLNIFLLDDFARMDS